MSTLNRLEKLYQKVQKERLDAYIVDQPIDLFYLLGLPLSLGRLVVYSDRATLFVDGRYFEACKAKLSIPVIQTQGYGKESAFYKQSAFRGKKVGFDQGFTSFSEYTQLKLLEADLIPLKSLVSSLRVIKDQHELTLLEKAADLCREGYFYILDQLKEGIEEQEVVCFLKIFWQNII